MSSPNRPFHNPFEVLRGRLGEGAPAPATPPAPSASLSRSPVRPSHDSGTKATGSIPRAVVRFERAGRGGKAVTIISHLEVHDRGVWLKSLKAALGCGGAIDGDEIVLQGDHRERLREWLAARGVRKVTIA